MCATVYEFYSDAVYASAFTYCLRGQISVQRKLLCALEVDFGLPFCRAVGGHLNLCFFLCSFKGFPSGVLIGIFHVLACAHHQLPNYAWNGGSRWVGGKNVHEMAWFASMTPRGRNSGPHSSDSGPQATSWKSSCSTRERTPSGGRSSSTYLYSWWLQDWHCVCSNRDMDEASKT